MCVSQKKRIAALIRRVGAYAHRFEYGTKYSLYTMRSKERIEQSAYPGDWNVCFQVHGFETDIPIIILSVGEGCLGFFNFVNIFTVRFRDTSPMPTGGTDHSDGCNAGA